MATRKQEAAAAQPETDTLTMPLPGIEAPPFEVAVSVKPDPSGQSKNALTMLPPAQRAVVALDSSKREVELQALVKVSADIVEVKNGDAREQVHRMAMNLKNARCELERTGKEAREDATAFSKAVIAEEKRLKDITEAEEKRLFALRDGYDAEQARIKREAEEREAARIAAIRAKIDAFQQLPVQLAAADSATLTAKLVELANTTPGADDYAEFTNEAATVIDTVGAALSELLAAAKRREEEARQRAEQQEQERARLAAAEAEAAKQKAEADKLRAEQERQQQALSQIDVFQKAAKVDTDLPGLRSLLAMLQDQVPDEALFGPLLGVAQLARDNAIAALQTRITTTAAAATVEEAATIAQMTVPAADPVDTAVAEVIQVQAEPEAPAPRTPAVDDTEAVQAFVQAVRDLSKTRDEAGIREVLEHALTVVYGVPA